MPAHSRFWSYDEAVAAHSWDVPERYNIAQDVATSIRPTSSRCCGRTSAATSAQVTWGELQDASNRLGSVLRQHGVEVGDRVAMLLTPTPETAAAFLGHLQGRRDPALAVRALRGRRDPSPCYGRAGARARHERRERRARPGARAPRRARPRPRRRPDRRRRPVVRAGRHGGRRSGPALLHLGHDGSREGDPPRPPLPPRAQRVRALPRRPRRRAVPRHGRVGLGRRHRAAARAVAVRRRSGRLRARGRLRPHKQLAFLSKYRGHERLQHADRDPLDDVDRRRRDALPAAVSHRLRRRRAAQPGGDPLVPSRSTGSRSSTSTASPRATRCAATSRSWTCARVRWGGRRRAGTSRSSTRTSSRCLPASAARSACVRAATRTTRSATGTTRMRRARPSTASGSTRRTLRAWTTTATSGTRAAPTT